MENLERELMSLREKLERLEAKDQITQQLARYGRGQEWLDEGLLNEVFFDDAYVDFGFFKGSWTEYRPILMKIEGSSDATFHFSGSPQIELKGDTAYVECYGIAAGRSKNDTNIYGGRYIDTFERRDGIWKIARRVYVLDWCLKGTAEAPGTGALAGINVIKERSPQNPLFRKMGTDVTR